MKFLFLLFSFCLSLTAFPQSVEKVINLPTTSSGNPDRHALLYLPDDYNSGSASYPLMVFLHGSGEAGTDLSVIYNSSNSGGPAYFIEHGAWPSSFTNPSDGKAYKFIVVSPQSNNSWSSSGDETENMVKYLVANYRVDINRIYITGLSAGGGGAVEYAAHLNGNENSLSSTRTYPAAAIVPLSAATNSIQQSWADKVVGDNVKAWGHGDPNNDTYGENTMNLVNDMNKDRSGIALFTPNNYGHGGWGNIYTPKFSQTINGTAMNIYQWMLTNTRGNTPPVTIPVQVPAPTVYAGSNQTITLPLALVTLTGNASAASGHYITNYSWSQTGGSGGLNIQTPLGALTIISQLRAGTYTFQLKVTQDDGQTATSSVTVTVNPLLSAPAAAPSVNASPNTTVNLPTSWVTLPGSATAASGHHITNYSWQQIVGTGGLNIQSPNAGSTVVSQFSKPGVYVFQLTATQDDGQTSLSSVYVTVNAATVSAPPVVNASPNTTITLPTSWVTLPGYATAATGHHITNYSWQQIVGNGGLNIQSPNAGATTVSQFSKPGVYVFQLTATQDDGQTALSSVYVTVDPAATVSVAAPTASAGNNQTINLPATSWVTLPGNATAASGHHITNYSWQQIAGTGGLNIQSPHSATTVVSQFSNPGIYAFQLTATQDDGQTTLSSAYIIVNASGTSSPTSPSNPTQPSSPTGGGVVSGSYASPVITATANASISTNSMDVSATYKITGSSLKSINWTKMAVPGIAKKKIGILGSSTAAGSGTDSDDSSFAGRLRNYYVGAGLVDSVINMSVSGYNPYQAMPTGFIPSSDVNAKLSPSDTPAVNSNITAMLRHHPDVVILCYPTNGYDVLTMPEIMLPLQTIYNTCVANNIECFITTSQPRTDATFGTASSQLWLQTIRDSILNRFGTHALDFYDCVATPGTTQQMPQYYYGDGIHLNDAAHRALFNVVLGANILKDYDVSSSVIATPTAQNTSLTNLPSGANSFLVSVTDAHGQVANAVTTVTVNGTAAAAPASGPCHGKKYIIAPDPVDQSVWITHTNSSYQPGDTLVLNANYSAVDIEGLIGTSSCPIVIMNQGVQARISQRLNLDGCQYVKVTGSGSSDQYGIRIEQDPQLRQQSYYAIQINDKSKDVEVERVYMHNIDIGIVCETNESCDNSLNYPNWTLDSMSFHDNKIVGTWNEGMYIGNTSPDNASYDLRPVTCSGTTSYPAPMKNGYTRIYNNIVDSTGRGGIQLANAASGVSEVYGNTVKHTGMNGDDAQGSAITLGLYTNAYVHDNTISCTYTWGIASIGAGSTNNPIRIEHNTIDSSGYLNAYSLATTSRTVYDPRTEPTSAPVLTWPQSIEIDTRTRLYTTDSPNPGTAIKGQDSTQFSIIGNSIGLKKNNTAINVDDDYLGIQKVGNLICSNVNKSNNTAATITVASGVKYSTNCTGSTATTTQAVTASTSFFADSAVDGLAKNNLLLHPNPARDNVLMEVNNSHTGRMLVQVLDPSGIVHTTYSFQKDGNSTQVTLSVAGFAPGLYFIRIQIGNWSKTEKLMKL
jgi:lysophospholipase L1-like esterase